MNELQHDINRFLNAIENIAGCDPQRSMRGLEALATTICGTGNIGGSGVVGALQSIADSIENGLYAIAQAVESKTNPPTTDGK